MINLPRVLHDERFGFYHRFENDRKSCMHAEELNDDACRTACGADGSEYSLRGDGPTAPRAVGHAGTMVQGWSDGMEAALTSTPRGIHTQQLGLFSQHQQMLAPP